MYEHNLVAVYASRAEAERVEDRLIQTGVPAGSIQLTSTRMETGAVDPLDGDSRSDEPHESLWKRLFSRDLGEHHLTGSETNFREDRTALSVRVCNEDERQRVADLLMEFDPVYIDQEAGLGIGRSTVGTAAPVDSGGTPITRAKEGERVFPVGMQLGANILWQVAPHAGGAKAERQGTIIDALGGILANTLAKFEIDNDLRVAHFLAQTCCESDGFCATVEYSSGEAYEKRADLGNVQLGDGTRYKGRGLIQLTGRDNYQRFGELLDLDLINAPELAADPATSLLIACQFWKDKNLNYYADRDDIETITRRINGGLNGLTARRTYLARAKAALAGQGGAAIVAETG
jgi:predicted chitinase